MNNLAGFTVPLAETLALAAEAWARMRSGMPLDRAAVAAENSVRGQLAAAPRTHPSPALRDLLYACARHRALLDDRLARLVHRQPEAVVAALIEAALALLLTGGHAEYTVVDQAVAAARLHPATGRAGGFVNATLRSYLRRQHELPPPAELPAAVRLNLPPWWLARLRAAYPRDWLALAEAQLARPPLVLRVNRRRAPVAEALASLRQAGLAAVPLGEQAIWLVDARPVERIPGFAAGRVSVQDAAAQLAAPWLQAGDGQRVLDACAAPGGKSAHLLELGAIELLALDSDPGRAARIAPDLERLGLNDPARVRVLAADAADPSSWWDGRPFDRVLLDAPCTASGIVRRHPDIPWLRRPGDVADLATRQRRLLDALWPVVAPAGRLLYAVCSVFPEEGQQQASGFLQRWPDAVGCQLVGRGSPTALLLPRAAAPEQVVEGFPPSTHDGFFFAAFEKTS